MYLAVDDANSSTKGNLLRTKPRYTRGISTRDNGLVRIAEIHELIFLVLCQSSWDPKPPLVEVALNVEEFVILE